MIVYRCDKCGCEIERGEQRYFEWMGRRSTGRMDAELCVPCRDTIQEMVQNWCDKWKGVKDERD